jgi:hypothetical protein
MKIMNFDRCRLPRDPDYDFGRELEDEKKNERSKPRESGAVYHRRGIVHSCFHNITFQECKKRMESMESGDAVFRPSSKVKAPVPASLSSSTRLLACLNLVMSEAVFNFCSLISNLLLGIGSYYSKLESYGRRHATRRRH